MRKLATPVQKDLFTDDGSLASPSGRLGGGNLIPSKRHRTQFTEPDDEFCYSCTPRNSLFRRYFIQQYMQGRSQDFTLGATGAERRRRENRGAEVVRIGRGCPSPQPTRRSGESCKLPQLGPGGAPAANTFLAYLRPTEHFWEREQCYLAPQQSQFFFVKKTPAYRSTKIKFRIPGVGRKCR